MHLAAELANEEFAQEMTAERLVDPDEEARATVNRRTRNLVSSKAGREWKRLNGRKNDWFDTSVYAFALAWHLEQKRRLTESRWADLLLQVHGTRAEPDLFDAAADNPFAKAKPVRTAETDAAREKRRKKWANRT